MELSSNFKELLAFFGLFGLHPQLTILLYSLCFSFDVLMPIHLLTIVSCNYY